MNSQRVYLDVCVLCRPFDDQNQTRIRLETTALELILAHIRRGERETILSPVHRVEIAAIQQEQEKQYLLLLLNQLATPFPFDFQQIRHRAEALADRGMGVADAAHVAFAEFTLADFVSVDGSFAQTMPTGRSNCLVWHTASLLR